MFSDPNEPMYTIGSVARLLKVSVQLLRLYEREGLILPVRSEAGHRRYSRSDVDRLSCIVDAIRKRKFSIAAIRKIHSLIPCWQIIGCSEADRQACPAFSTESEACWVVKGRMTTCTSRDCRLCVVYQRSVECSSIKQFIIDATTSPAPPAPRLDQP